LSGSAAPARIKRFAQVPYIAGLSTYYSDLLFSQIQRKSTNRQN
jgi:hypothetical protein